VSVPNRNAGILWAQPLQDSFNPDTLGHFKFYATKVIQNSFVGEMVMPLPL